MHTIADVMTLEPVTVPAVGSLRECLSLMTRHGIRHLPVVDERERLLGLIYDFQLLRHCNTAGAVPVPRAGAAGRTALSLAVTAGCVAQSDLRVVDALGMLSSGWEDAVIVVDHAHRPVGIFTLHDALRMGTGWLTPWWQVWQTMTRACWALPGDMPVRRAMRLLWTEQRAHALISSGPHVTGAVSLRDLVAVEPSRDAVVDDLRPDYPIPILSPQTTLVEAARVLLREKRGCLPVVAGGLPKGMFTTADLLRALRRTVNVATTRAS